MLYELFIRLMNMSITASVVIVAVLALRAFMGKMPKRYSYVLWTIVAVRLLCPVGLASPVSVFNLLGEHELPFTEYWQENTADSDTRQDRKIGKAIDEAVFTDKKDGSYQAQETEPGGESAVEGKINTEAADSKADSVKERNNSVTDAEGISPFVRYGTIVWLSIAAILVIWNFVLLLLMKRKVSRAIRLRDNVYECDNIPTPFVMGFVTPKIYIPFRLDEAERDYIIKHERHHIDRRDNIVKLVAFLITCIYWFHPLVWISYFLMIRDMEMSCDEYVLQKSTTDIREAYSRSLLGFATNQRNIGAGLIAYGESDTRKRVKHIMQFKECGKWLGMVAVGLVIAAGVVCLTDAEKKDIDVTEQSKKIDGDGDGSNESTDFYYAVAKTQIHGYQVEFQYVSDAELKKKPESGYYKGDQWEIQTSKDGEKMDRYELSVPEPEFPVDGFELHVADYDGDGEKDDFALGYGDRMDYDPMLGYYMSYRFFGVDEDGKIVAYHTSTEDRVSIAKTHEYSPVFERKDGVVRYNGLSEEGVIEEMSTDIVRYISVDDIQNTKQEPEYSLMKNIEKNMPPEIVKELQENGVWHVSYGDDEMAQYNLANDGAVNSADDITLRLDFTYQGDRLVRYTAKDYGFMDEVKSPKESIYMHKVLSFAEDFTGVKSKFVEIFDKISNGMEFSCNVIGLSYALPKKWDDGNRNHSYYKDTGGSAYLYDRRIDMVIAYDKSSQ